MSRLFAAVRVIRAHAAFAAVLAIGVALRAAAMIGYRGVLWFPDSRSYIRNAVDLAPSVARPQGYALFLHALEPLRSFAAVAAVQHLLGLAVGAGVYAVVRRYALPGWAGALAAAPVLLDAHEIQLEHVLLSDTLFLFLVAAAVLVLLWRPRSVAAAGVAGLLAGAATVTRSVGLPLLALVAAYLVIRWWRGTYGPRARGWRPVVAAVLAGAVPVVAYGLWFQASTGTFGITRSSGVFLYSRTTTFVDCDRVRMPAPEAKLCPAQPLGARRPAPSYIWQRGPIGRVHSYPKKFTVRNDRMASAFARRAILGQPLGYLRVSLRDLARTFAWTRADYPNAYDTAHYLFPGAERLTYPGRSTGGRLATLKASGPTLAAVHAYGGDGGRAAVVEPAAGFLRAYQSVVYLRGPMVAVLLLGAPAVVAVRRMRRHGAPPPGWGPAWSVGVTLIVVPPFTAAFDYRYILPAVPLLCVALALACARGRPPRDVPAPAALAMPSDVADTAAGPDVPDVADVPEGASTAPPSPVR